MCNWVFYPDMFVSCRYTVFIPVNVQTFQEQICLLASGERHLVELRDYIRIKPGAYHQVTYEDISPMAASKLSGMCYDSS